MSSHLRHCPKHRKPLPCPHCALTQPAREASELLRIGSELAKQRQEIGNNQRGGKGKVMLPALSVGQARDKVANAPAPEPLKLGRPRKHVDAAAKQEAYRERLSAKQQDSERRNLLAKILKRISKQMPFSNLVGNSVYANNRTRLRQLQAELKHISLDNLKSYSETLEEGHDQTGRLWGERSGEADRKYGQSEMERIVAGRQHDVSLGETSWQDPLMASQFRVRPDGAAPDSEEEEETSSAKRRQQPVSDQRRQKAIDRIVDQIFSGDNQCLFCNQVFANKLAAERHLFEAYERGEAEDRKWNEYLSAIGHFSIKTSNGVAPWRIDSQSKTIATHHRDLIDIQARKRKHGIIVTNHFETEKSPHPTEPVEVSAVQ